MFITNPAGVYIGNGAFVNVGQLFAAAGTISNVDFLAGVNHFTDLNGAVVNHGTIEAGLVGLIGKEVANHGIIMADKGLITMVAGDDVLLGERDGHMFVKIKGAAPQTDEGESDVDNPDISASSNEGNEATASEGNEAAASEFNEANASSLGAGDMYSLVIRNTGTLKADEILIEGRRQQSRRRLGAS